MNDIRPAEVFPPGEFIKDELEERGWTQADLAEIVGRPLPAINQIINGARAITPETAIELAQAFGTSAELWLNLETAYQLSKVQSTERSEIRQRAEMFETAPVKEMQKRGWIKKSAGMSIGQLKSELDAFFSLPEIHNLRVAARTSVQSSELTSEQVAWCVQALRLAKSVPVKSYSKQSMMNGIKQLRMLANFPENTRKVPLVLAACGVRFVIVEHLQKSKIDGAALWLGDAWDKPVIALSLRYDRIDSFWHTLMHECSHILNEDSYILDVDLVTAERCLSNEDLSEIENRANADAANWLIPKQTLRDFILRHKPFFSKTKIYQFANLLNIHPGIIAGQLQHRGETTWAANREMLVKVRDIVISGTMSDGWRG